MSAGANAPRAVFYHLTRSGLFDTVLMILQRAYKAGWPVLLRAPDPQRIAALDAGLWTGGAPKDFLPHGLQGAPDEDQQPILLGMGALPARARGLMLLDGAQTTAEEAALLERVWVLFDGADQDQLTRARALWSALTSGGMAAQYWSDEDGQWALKVERPAAAG